ncbi:hypothetical protein [Motiliproteus sp. SC1-56]|uniref:hypothetical protein n=1 Tax=Motiliproteus sp. SC1-56 TaxID=2799565 RepID=UPI001A8D6660|nr:hypothetical protein [Motiliproteus sp. SC1-56]
MDLDSIEEYRLEHLRDASFRDRLLAKIFSQHQRDGVPSPLAKRFLARFDLLAGLILNEGPGSPRVQELYAELQGEFGSSRAFKPILEQLHSLATAPRPQPPRHK